MMIAQRFVHQKNDVEDCRRRRSIDRSARIDGRVDVIAHDQGKKN